MYTFFAFIIVFGLGVACSQVKWEDLYNNVFSFYGVSHIVRAADNTCEL
ncbi:MAG: hypothetical protein P4M11_14015 [Candidatus Pacebacteria bacterium]|nr:hypothetical protein [Candidatus Paceibacterota bacterium]